MTKPLSVAHRPDLISESAYVAPNATLIGDVHIKDEACILFGAVLRGDCEPISIGEQSNIQDLCCLHADPAFPVQLGRELLSGTVRLSTGQR